MGRTPITTLLLSSIRLGANAELYGKLPANARAWHKLPASTRRDAICVFDNAFIPWENGFIHRDVDEEIGG
ncbi:MAG TPA: hypothetical protein VH678_13605 [Xanthobacteraceae bacterium]|jgi:aromatic ring hydroxylase